MGIALIIVMFCVHIQLRYMFRNICDLGFPECQDIQELRHEINVWRRAAESLSSYSKDEEIVRISLEKKVRMLMIDLKEKLNNKSVAIDKYTANLEELQSK
ncbi:P protein-like, partial [Nilaparvata lugens]